MGAAYQETCPQRRGRSSHSHPLTSGRVVGLEVEPTAGGCSQSSLYKEACVTPKGQAPF